MMNILFIGGTGNLSAPCAALLRERGHTVYVLTRGRGQIPEGCHPLVADRHDLESMRRALQGIDLDVALDFIGFDIPDLELDYAILKDRVRQYLFISSTTVYARPPQKLPFTEDVPLGNAFWDYAQKKVHCEAWLRERMAEGFPVTIVRPSHTYSERWIPNSISSSSFSFAARLESGKPVFIHDNGETPWTLTAASDFAVGVCGLVGLPAALGEAFHITSDEVQPWSRIYAEIAEALGVSSPNIVPVPTDFICQVAPRMIGPLRGDKANPGIFDNSKIKKFVPEFACRKPFRQGIRESVAWLRAHPAARLLSPEVDALCDQVVTAWLSRPK